MKKNPLPSSVEKECQKYCPAGAFESQSSMHTLKTFRPTILQHNQNSFQGSQPFSEINQAPKLNSGYIPRPGNISSPGNPSGLTTYSLPALDNQFSSMFKVKSSELNNESLKMVSDSATLLNSNDEINRTNSSLYSSGSPFRDGSKTMFDLNSDLNTDLSEFNAFFTSQESRQGQIERPQNPFHKNFESYKNQSRKHAYSNSFTDALTSDLVNPKALMKKYDSHPQVLYGSMVEGKMGRNGIQKFESKMTRSGQDFTKPL